MKKRPNRKRGASGFSRLLATNALLAVGLAAALGSGGLLGDGSKHAEFYSAGSSIKGFLGDYCSALSAAIETADSSKLNSFYAADFFAAGRGAWLFGPGSREGSVEVLPSRRAGDEDVPRAARLAELRDYLSDFRSVDEAACKIHLIETLEGSSHATLTVRFVLGGTDRAGRSTEDRLFFRWRIREGLQDQPEAANGPSWLIESDELLRGARTRGAAAFQRLDAVAAGIDFSHRRDPRLSRHENSAELLFDVMQHASGAVSVADFDGDLWPDVFLGDGVSSKLYRNLGTGSDGRPRFQDVTHAVGLPELGAVHSALFFDVENDGDRDLFVNRYLAPARIFLNDGAGRFEDRTAQMGLDLTVPGSSLTALDFDRDGFLDLYLGVYGNAFDAFPRLPFYATNAGKNILLRNDGGGRFEDVSGRSGTDDSGWSLAVASGDTNGDGWPDLAVANDFGRKTLFINQGDGTFTEEAKPAGVLDFSGGMGLAFGDWDDDGRLDLYTSNIYSNQRWYGEDQTVMQYMRNVLRTRWAVLDLGEYFDLYGLVGDEWRALGQMIGEGNSLFHNQGDGTFRELKDTPASFAGWSWSVAFLDWDNDTDLDLYAANGWISATPGTDL